MYEKGEESLVLPFRKGELEGFVGSIVISTSFLLPSAGELFIPVYKTGYLSSLFHKRGLIVELKGKIDDYGIADIFQLIGQQSRSGVLTIRGGKRVAEVVFVQGLISRAFPAYYVPKKNPIGECAVKAKLITDKDLQKALAVQERTLKTLEEIFLEMKYLDALQIQKLHDFLLSETLYEVLQWKSGEYEFAMKEVDHDERFCDLISVDRILLDILRMIDEEPDLLRRVPNFNIVFQKTRGDGEGLKNLEFDETEETYEDIVCGFIDGTNTVQDLIDRSLLGRYHTLSALVSLMDGGLIKKGSIGRAAAQQVVPKRKRFITYASYSFLPIMVVIFLSLRIITADFCSWREFRTLMLPPALEQNRLQKVTNVLHVYYLSRGEFPVSLQKLVDDDFIDPRDITFAAGSPYRYTLLDPRGLYRLE